MAPRASRWVLLGVALVSACPMVVATDNITLQDLLMYRDSDGAAVLTSVDAIKAYDRCVVHARKLGWQGCTGPAASGLAKGLQQNYGAELVKFNQGAEAADVVRHVPSWRERLPNLFAEVFSTFSLDLEDRVEALRETTGAESVANPDTWQFLDRCSRASEAGTFTGRLDYSPCDPEKKTASDTTLDFERIRCETDILVKAAYQEAYRTNVKKLPQLFGQAFARDGDHCLASSLYEDRLVYAAGADAYWVENPVISARREELKTDLEDLKDFRDLSSRLLAGDAVPTSQEATPDGAVLDTKVEGQATSAVDTGVCDGSDEACNAEQESSLEVTRSPHEVLDEIFGELPGKLQVDELRVVVELTSRIDSLPSERQRRKMRDLLKLPQVVVVGQQSHGKSTTLEMLAGLNFLPRGGGVVTTRPFRISIHQNASAAVPHGEVVDGGGETERYEGASYAVKLKQKLHTMNPPQISLRPVDVKLHNPGAGPNLTLVDLPGIVARSAFESGAKEKVERLVDEFCSPESTIILLVHDCSNDFANNPVQQLIKERFDPDFSRTFGVLTKMNLDSCYKVNDLNFRDQATNVMNILANDPGSAYSFPIHGWVGITGQTPRDMVTESVQTTREKEQQFFEGRGFHDAVGADQIARLPRDEGRLPFGTEILRERIGKALKKNIQQRLPMILQVVENQLHQVHLALADLNDPPPTSPEGRLDFLRSHVLEPWRRAVQSALFAINARPRGSFWGVLEAAARNGPSPIPDYSYIRGYPVSNSAQAACAGPGGRGTYLDYEESVACRRHLFASKTEEIAARAHAAVLDKTADEMARVAADAFARIGA